MKKLAALVMFASLTAFAADGKAVFQQHCKGCHGPDGKADTKIGHKAHIPDFTSSKFQKSVTDAQIKDVITNGSKKNKKMKAFKEKLSQEEIDAVAKYVRDFGSNAAAQ
jgi:mono/diheme cytochrome c family protein